MIAMASMMRSATITPRSVIINFTIVPRHCGGVEVTLRAYRTLEAYSERCLATVEMFVKRPDAWGDVAPINMYSKS